MLANQIKHAVKSAAKRTPLATLARMVKPERPLDAALRMGRKHGHEAAARELLNQFGSVFAVNQNLFYTLEHDINRDYEVEILLTCVRAEILLNHRSLLMRPEIQKFARAMIAQCANNEYVWFVSSREQEAIERKPSHWTEHVAHAMYRPAHELGEPSKEMPEALCSLLTDYLSTYEQELSIKAGMPTFAPIDDPMSKRIREMYESYPYPRWININKPAPGSRTNMLREMAAPTLLPWLDGEFDVLMPGCGTGRKAIQLALAFPNACVLCADLSRSSLSYLMRMAQKHGAKNIEPLQIDIYDLPKLGRKFHYIECSGVLHHLGDPVRGGQAVTACLLPGGMFRISMYSELARREVVRHRKAIGNDRIPNLSSNDLRAYRRTVMTTNPDCIDKLPTPGDFFDLSRCKDLIAHPNEYRYTIPQLRDYFDQIGVEFCGFTLPRINRHTMWTSYPPKSERRNLDAWWAIERRSPDLFEDLYDAWTIKR